MLKLESVTELIFYIFVDRQSLFNLVIWKRGRGECIRKAINVNKELPPWEILDCTFKHIQQANENCLI